MHNIRKILCTVSEKTALPTKQPINQPTNQPTNQPIITNNTDLIGPRWRRSNKRLVYSIDFLCMEEIFPWTYLLSQLGILAASTFSLIVLNLFYLHKTDFSFESISRLADL